MSSLTPAEKHHLEQLLDMSSGYVLDFTNASFKTFFFDTVGIDIYSDKYRDIGSSKAKLLRGFWRVEGDTVVGKAMSQLLEYWRAAHPSPTPAQQSRYESCTSIVSRLLARTAQGPSSTEVFLKKDFSKVSVNDMDIDAGLQRVLNERIAEAEQCLNAEACLAAIFLCGSVLEGLLLATAVANPSQFNSSSISPKSKSQKPKPFHEWRLAELIDVAHAEGLLRLDVKKFSHALRDFRNYIHPHQQWTSKFDPDQHTAKICMQVLRAAISNLSK